MSLFHITVPAGTELVEYVHGICTRVLEPGRHRRAWRATYLTVGTRERVSTLALQEIPPLTA